MRLRRLRDRLIALAAGLVLLVTVLTVLAVRATTVEALRDEMRAALASAGRPFDNAQREVVELLFMQAEQLTNDPNFQRLRVESLDLIKSPVGTSRHQQGLDYLQSFRLELKPLVDIVPDADRPPIADLLVMVQLDGSLLVEWARDRQPRNLDGVRLDIPVLKTVLADGSAMVTYSFYPDDRGDLYLLAALPLLRGDYVDGALLLGRRVDDQEASQAAQAVEGAVVYVVAGGRVLGAADGIALPRDPTEQKKLEAERKARREALEAWLATFTPGPVSRPPPEGVAEEPPLQQALLGRASYLIQPHPLWSEFAPEPIGWILFTKDLAPLQRRVAEQIRILAGIGVLGILLALLLSARIAGLISRPIEALAGKMRRVGEGDLDQTAEERGSEEVAQLAASFNQMTTGLRQKHVLEKYVPLGARKQIEENVEGRIVLGGQRVKLTIFFSDLRGFTSMSERLEPGEVVDILNEYLERMTKAIIDHRGDINEYIGDAILAVFHEPEGACMAVRAALLMQQELADLRARRAGTVLAELRMGIGLNTGEVVEGNIGTRDRLKYSVVGDAVNLAARIQDRSRDGAHTCILLSESTRQDLGEEFELAFFGDVQFKGKSAPVGVWEVVGPAAPAGASSGAPEGPEANPGG